MAQTTPKSNRPRSNSLLTRSGTKRIKVLNLSQLYELREVTTNKKARSKMDNRLKVLLTRI